MFHGQRGLILFVIYTCWISISFYQPIPIAIPIAVASTTSYQIPCEIDLNNRWRQVRDARNTDDVGLLTHINEQGPYGHARDEGGPGAVDFNTGGSNWIGPRAYGICESTKILAAHDGVVSAKCEGVNGNCTSLGGYVIRVKNGNVETIYAHAVLNSLQAVGLQNGDIVHQGQHIGTIGQTGAATGPHIHFYSQAGASGDFGFVMIDNRYRGEFVEQNFQQFMISDTYQQIRVRIRNTGTMTWDNNTKIYALPLDQGSPFYDLSWLSPYRITTSGVVQPGETGTFEFTIRAPTIQGEYQLSLAFVQEGITWFNLPEPGSITLPIKVMAPVSVTTNKNRLVVFDYVANQSMKYCAWNESQLTPWTDIDNSRTEYTIAGLIDHQGTIDVFVRGATGLLWHRRRENNRWEDWTNLGGQLQGPPIVVRSDSGQIHVFIRGAGNAIFQRTRNGQIWSEWKNLGGTTSFAPAVVASGMSRLDLFIRDDDRSLRHRSWDGEQWSEWENLEGRLQGPPAVVASAVGHIHVLVRGMSNAIFLRTWNGETWSAWEDLGGITSFPPAVVMPNAHRLDVFIRDDDTSLRHRFWNGTQWSEWENLEGRVVGAPVAVSWGTERIGVFVRGNGGDIFNRVWDGVQWKPWDWACAKAYPLAQSPVFLPIIQR